MRNSARVVVALVLAAGCGTAQTDPLQALRAFAGKWEGTAVGKPGKGLSKREYRFELNGRFLEGRNLAVYEPKAAGEKGEVHRDLGMFSYDRALKKLVLRQFHGEGFVNEYTGEVAGAAGSGAAGGNGVLEFVTVKIENIPAGWRAREVYRFVSADELVETFSLAAPGQDFEVYSETRLKRVK